MRVWKDFDEDTSRRLLVTLTIGDFFGEGTLLEHLDGRKGLATATVECASFVELLTLTYGHTQPPFHLPVHPLILTLTHCSRPVRSSLSSSSSIRRESLVRVLEEHDHDVMATLKESAAVRNKNADYDRRYSLNDRISGTRLSRGARRASKSGESASNINSRRASWKAADPIGGGLIDRLSGGVRRASWQMNAGMGSRRGSSSSESRGGGGDGCGGGGRGGQRGISGGGGGAGRRRR